MSTKLTLQTETVILTPKKNLENEERKKLKNVVINAFSSKNLQTINEINAAVKKIQNVLHKTIEITMP